MRSLQKIFRWGRGVLEFTPEAEHRARLLGDQKPKICMDIPISLGVAADSLGIILQRGGEEIRLEKVSDRFTLSLNNTPPGWQSRIPAQYQGTIANTQLELFSVASANLDTVMATVRNLDFVAFASHVYRLVGNPQSRVYLTKEITLQFASDTSEAQINALATKFSLDFQAPLVGIPHTFIFGVNKQATENPIKISNRLMDLPEVLTAEPNIIIRQDNLYRPQDKLYPQQWYLQNIGGKSLGVGSHINVEAAWDVTRGDRSVVIAIADDGVDLTHPDFQGTGKVVAPYNFQNPNALPIPATDDENHGTSCAGVAVAEENGTGVVGVAPGCALMPLKTTGYLDDQSIEDIFNWAIDHNASVISCSWGAAAIYFPISLRQRAAITKAATLGRNGKGCIVVFAAGNSNRPVNGTVDEQGWENNIFLGKTKWLSGFAVHPDVIGVAATTSLGKKAAYSNWGNISVSAPSSNAPPGVSLEQGYVFTAPALLKNPEGLGVFTSDRLGAAGYSPTDFTDSFGGTSSACPVVAGVAGLILSANPDLTAPEVREILQQTADKITDIDADPQLGTKLGSYDQKGYSQWFGYGKVNAAKAVQAAIARKTAPSQTLNQITIQGSNNTPVNIPDDDPKGASSLIRITEAGTVKEVLVTIELTHQFLGDVEIYLQSPGSQQLLLQNRSLGNQTQLQTTYSLLDTPSLKKLLNQPITGLWQLVAIDNAALDTGTLTSWQLQIGI